MDKIIARHVAKASFQSWKELADLVYWTKVHCTPEVHQVVGKAIATACAKVILEVQNKMSELYPEFEQEYGESMQKYDRII